MATTYEPIANTTLSSSAASITFSSIDGGFTDLKLVFLFTGTSNILTKIQFNGDTGNNYSVTVLGGDGTSIASTKYNNQDNIGGQSSFVQANTPGLFSCEIFGYSGSKNKTVLCEKSFYSNSTFKYVNREVGLWRNTAAITSITISGNINFSAGTTATLYGIKAA